MHKLIKCSETAAAVDPLSDHVPAVQTEISRSFTTATRTDTLTLRLGPVTPSHWPVTGHRIHSDKVSFPVLSLFYYRLRDVLAFTVTTPPVCTSPGHLHERCPTQGVNALFASLDAVRNKYVPSMTS